MKHAFLLSELKINGQNELLDVPVNQLMMTVKSHASCQEDWILSERSANEFFFIHLN